MSGSESRLLDWIRQACLLEVRSEKPGNVSPTHVFDNASLRDFETSARVIAPILAQAGCRTVGEAIRNAVQATRNAVGHNTNLGIVLLLAPLSAVPLSTSLSEGIETILRDLTVSDAVAVYEAINIAAPAGLGTAEAQDVADIPSVNLRECMRLAADRDQIAAEYVNGFSVILNVGQALLEETADWTPLHRHQRIAWVAVNLLARFGDTLIRRKCGADVDSRATTLARHALTSGWPQTADGQRAYEKLDRFLRADGHRRNPGTTADIIAAIIFAALRSQRCFCNAEETQLLFLEESDVGPV
ncbi:MAG: triphosphoribosyl-dephospho-CoA synthase [Planctomycetaceae bacterium]